MAEVALNLTPHDLRKGTYRFVCPEGAVIEAITDERRRRKWIEIICDLSSPRKRDHYRRIPGWKRICEAWSPQLRTAWMDLERGKHRLAGWSDAEFWAHHIEPLGLLADLPQAPGTDRRVYETWLWSQHERKVFFIVVNDDEPDVEIWRRKRMTGAAEEGNMVIRPGRVLNFRTDIGLSLDTVAKILDPARLVHPRFDKPVGRDTFKDATLIDMAEGVIERG